VDEVEEVEPPAPSEPVVLSDPLITAVRDLLVSARGERRDLLDDRLVESICWADGELSELCRVTPGVVELNREHSLVHRVLSTGDRGAEAFLASVVCSAINAFYAEITDPDELEFQARLVRKIRE
jgi:hypothetical protein